MENGEINDYSPTNISRYLYKRRTIDKLETKK